MPSQTFVHRAVAGGSGDTVWAALQRVETWQEIGGVLAVTEATFDSAGLTGYRFTAEAGGTIYSGRARRMAIEVGHQMTMGIETEQLTGTITVRLEPAEPGTAVEVRMEIVSRGLMTAMLFPVIAASVGRGFSAAAARFIDSLARDS